MINVLHEEYQTIYFITAGTVEMHGLEVTPKWCSLGETADAGSNQIVINQETNWKVGDQIAISSSSFSPKENEDFFITALSYDTGKTSITLDRSFMYKHIAMEQTIDGTVIKTAAKVQIGVQYSVCYMID